MNYAASTTVEWGSTASTDEAHEDGPFRHHGVNLFPVRRHTFDVVAAAPHEWAEEALPTWRDNRLERRMMGLPERDMRIRGFGELDKAPFQVLPMPRDLPREADDEIEAGLRDGWRVKRPTWPLQMAIPRAPDFTF